jgi:hypothetical protein
MRRMRLFASSEPLTQSRLITYSFIHNAQLLPIIHALCPGPNSSEP